MKRIISAVLLGSMLAALGGCAVYPAPYGYGPRAYVEPAPVYVAPRVYYRGYWGR